MSTRVWNGLARTLTLSVLLFSTLICLVLGATSRHKYVILSPLHESRVKEGARKTEEFVFQPMFDLSAINAACNLNIPEDMFTTCRNKVYPILNKVTNQTQMGILPTIHMLGERHSATNLAAHLAVRNFELVFNKTRQATLKYPTDFGINKHKHNIQENGSYEKGLSIISIKNPYDYTRSMLKECYNCGPQEKNRGNASAFLGTEWHKGAHVGRYHFENLMVMRKEKYCNYLEKAAELTDCIMMVHSEDNVLPIQQEHYVWRIATMTGWPLKEGVVRTKSDYSGHSAGGDARKSFELSKLVDGITYFKKDFSEHEENVIHAVNENMIDDFEKAFGYHRIKVPEKPPKQSDKKNAHSEDDIPLASILDVQLDKISDKAPDDIQNLQEGMQEKINLEEDDKRQGQVREGRGETPEEAKHERLGKLQAVLSEYARHREQSQAQKNF
ncbi:hypothetical protein M9434_001755 [Picochlorum sp. BPE23]|nr:hypothetical protein M9434_001755 [Picochlorum sp. BPE23]